MFAKYPNVDVSDKTCQALLRSLVVQHPASMAWQRLEDFRNTFDLKRNVEKIQAGMFLSQKLGRFIAVYHIKGFRLARHDQEKEAWLGYVDRNASGFERVVTCNPGISVPGNDELVQRVLELPNDLDDQAWGLINDVCLEGFHVTRVRL